VILVPPAANAADAALYQAKERGRDQVAVFQAPDA
jgi:PleD family two-component response regulator